MNIRTKQLEYSHSGIQMIMDSHRPLKAVMSPYLTYSGYTNKMEANNVIMSFLMKSCWPVHVVWTTQK